MVVPEGVVNFDFFNMPPSKKKWRDGVTVMFFCICTFRKSSLKIEAEIFNRTTK